MTLKPWAWAGLGISCVGVAVLIGFAFVDLGRADQMASVAGGSAGIVGLVLAAIVQFGGTTTPPTPPTPPVSPAPVRTVAASGDGAIAAGGNIGTASTGGTTAPPPPSPTPPPSSTPPNGGVNASGRGSIAAGGDIGSASTGN